MASSAPKAVPKIVPQKTAGAEEEVPVKSGKKKMVVIIAAVLLLAGGGGGAWYYMQQHSAHPKTAKPAPPAAPVFVPLETFTVNLKSEEADQYLQTQFSLQVADQAQADIIKLYMPQVRSRLLTLLSSKMPNELNSTEGKTKLVEQIKAQLNLPFSPGSEPQKITNVFFTSFVIQ